jgi:hypothetical protein
MQQYECELELIRQTQAHREVENTPTAKALLNFRA